MIDMTAVKNKNCLLGFEVQSSHAIKRRSNRELFTNAIKQLIEGKVLKRETNLVPRVSPLPTPGKRREPGKEVD